MQRTALMDALGYTFTNETLLEQALTHPSLQCPQADNQRLEFLGDAVLELCVSDALYRMEPDVDEGVLTQRRIALVREETLADAALRLHLRDYLHMAHGEVLTGGLDKPSILADALEAVLGAVYLDGGLSAAQAVADRMLQSYRTPAATARRDWKSQLQEKLQQAHRDMPMYEIIGEEGPQHALVFTAQVQCGQDILGEGRGHTKKEAEQQAARVCLERLTADGDKAPPQP